MTIFIYNLDSLELAETVTGDNQNELERYAQFHYPQDTYGATYTPSFLANDGLVENLDAKHTTLDGKGWS